MTNRQADEAWEKWRSFVLRSIPLQPLADRVLKVLRTLPPAVLDDLRHDQGFHLDMENYQPGRGTQVWLPVPGETWSESRTVVLRPRLNHCREDFALYVIAHELAHAYLRNGGWGEIRDPEEAADALAASWGYARPSDLSGIWWRWSR